MYRSCEGGLNKRQEKCVAEIILLLFIIYNDKSLKYKVVTYTCGETIIEPATRTQPDVRRTRAYSTCSAIAYRSLANIWSAAIAAEWLNNAWKRPPTLTDGRAALMRQNWLRYTIYLHCTQNIRIDRSCVSYRPIGIGSSTALQLYSSTQ